MADTKMTREAREAFLEDLHVGVLSIPNGEAAPLTAPVWYDYRAGGDLWFLTGKTSQKGKLLKVGVPVTIVAQSEQMPYAYVSVEGSVSAIRACDKEADTRPMARRYLGEQMGDMYTENDDASTSVHVSVTPTRWLTVDYSRTQLG